MSTKSHKPFNLNRVEFAMNHLVSLQEELDGIQETEGEMEEAMVHVRALQNILESSRKPLMKFSSMTKNELEHLGIARKQFSFLDRGIDELLSKPNAPDIIDQFTTLNTRLAEVYDHVNMDCEGGTRMILHAILFSMDKISALRKVDHAVSILPEMSLAIGYGVMVKHPSSSYKVRLTGNVDYGVIRYPLNKSRLRDAATSQDDLLALAASWFFLVHVRGPSESLPQHMPEAVGQAVVLSELTNKNTVHFCLSNGCSWIFAILTKNADGQRVYYESTARYLHKDLIQRQDEESLRSVQEIVELVLQWLEPAETPSSQALYNLRD